MDGMVNGGGTNPALHTPDVAEVGQIGSGAMGKDRRVRGLVWAAVIAAAVVALMAAAPPTRIEAESWTGWTSA